jgi:hypothetical protein
VRERNHRRYKNMNEIEMLAYEIGKLRTQEFIEDAERSRMLRNIAEDKTESTIIKRITQNFTGTTTYKGS